MSRARILKTGRNIGITVAVMLLLFGIAGVLYVLLAGGEHASKKNAVPVASTSEPFTAKPTPPAANAQEGVAIGSLTSPAPKGSNVALTARTNAGSNCTISAVYAGKPSYDSGLAPKKADDFGTVTWTWTIDSSVPVGKWPVTVTCTYNGRTGVMVGSLEVTN